MRAETLLTRLLETQGWRLRAWQVDDPHRTVTVHLEPTREWADCSGCGAASRRLRGVLKRRRWRHLPLGLYGTVVEAPLRRVDCRSCRRLSVGAVPWARPGSRLSRQLEDLVLRLAREASFLAVAHHFGVTWKVVAALVRRLIRWYSRRTRRRALRLIGVDEVS